MVKAGFPKSNSLYLYKHVITRQVVQSPTKVLQNRAALAQLPPNRKLRPPALRKDHWVPLCKVEFADEAHPKASMKEDAAPVKHLPRSRTMFQVYNRLLDYRRWRQLERVPSTSASEGSAESHLKAHFINVPKKRRLREENEHVASSVADLAAAIETFTLRDTGAPLPVVIKWLDTTDAEHATRWSENVTHQGGLYTLQGHRLIETAPSVDAAETVSTEAPAAASA